MAGSSFGGLWTGQKLEILRTVFERVHHGIEEPRPFHLIYVDAFAGGGSWRGKSEYESDDYGDFREFSQGSPRIALEIRDKAFDRLVFIEIDRGT